MDEPLPLVELEKGKDRSVDFVGPGVNDWDWDDYTPCGLICTDLSLDLNTDTSADAETKESGKVLRIHFVSSTDHGSAVSGLYRYGLYGTTGGKTVRVGTEGTLAILPAT